MKTISSRKVNFVLQKVFFITIFNVLCFSTPCLYADAQLLYSDDFEDGNINVAAGAQGMTWTVPSGSVNLGGRKLGLNRGVGTVVLSDQSINVDEFTLKVDVELYYLYQSRIMFLYKDSANYYSVRVDNNAGVYKTVNGVESKIGDGAYIAFSRLNPASNTLKIHVKRQPSGITIRVDKNGDGIDYDLSIEDQTVDISVFSGSVRVGFADEGTVVEQPGFLVDNVALYSGEPVTPMPSPVTYYVDAALGLDTNSGTAGQPFLTIGKAAGVVLAGDTVIVRNGTYPERITLSNLLRRGGTDKLVTFKSETRGGAKMNGFEIDIDYIQVEGFDMAGMVLVNANHLQVLNNNVHDIRGVAITSGWRPDRPATFKIGAYILIRGNYISNSNMGIGIGGNNWLVENNEIERLIMPPGGLDADYMRVFGENHVIRGNYCHGTIESEIGDSHTDFLQTFNNNNGYAQHILVEQNFVKDFYHQGFMLEGANGSHDDFVIRNNIFIDAGSWGVSTHGVTNVLVENNTFVNIGANGVGFRLSLDNSTGSSGVVKDNIFYNCPNSYFADVGSQISGDYNLTYLSGDPAVPSQTNILNRDPLFVNVNNPLGPDGIPFTADDGFHLQSGSPALNSGEGGREIGAYGNISGNSVALKQKVASAFQLYQNYPNPFNSTTNIQFCVPTDGHVSVYVFNIFGQVLTIPFEGEVKAGRYQSVQINGTNLNSGVYFYRVTFGTQSITKRMVLIK